MEFRLLGPLEVAGDREVRLEAHKPRALVALLLLSANEVVSSDRLIEALWDGDPPRSADKLLQTYVSQLRKELGADRIVTRSPGYLMSVAHGELDVERFEHAKTPREALALWRGAPLAEFEYETWAQPEIARLNEARLVALEARVELDLDEGRHSELVPELESLVAAHPLRERLRAQLMLALYRAGRQADALATYRDARRILVDELGIEPSRRLQQLERAILRQDPELDALPRRPGDAQSLIGRESILIEIAALLETSRLVTLVGPGGIGKTRLALEVPDGVVVELAALADPRLVAGEIAQTLGIPEPSLLSYLAKKELLLVLDNFEQVVAAAPLLEELLAAAPRLSLLVTSRTPLRLAAETRYQVPSLEASDAAALFVERARVSRPGFEATDLDAVEELCTRLDGLPLAIELAAARAALLSPRAILDRLGRRLDVLRTADAAVPDRHRTLRAAVEWSYDLLGAAEQDLFSALAVFNGGFNADAADAVAAADALDGLAVMLDSSLIRSERAIGDEPRFGMLETIREYALERLSERSDAAALRHRHAAFYCELAERAEPALRGRDQVAWLRRLDAERENVRAAVAGDDAELSLRIAASLWRYWQTRGGTGEVLGHMRRRLAEDVREPVRSEAVAAAGRLAFFHGDLELASTFLDESLATVRDAVSLAVRGGIALARGDFDEASRLAEESASAARIERDWFARALALVFQGELLYLTGEFRGARRSLEEAVRAAREAGDLRNIARGLNSLASVLLAQHDYERATVLLEEALATQQQLRDLWGIPRSLVSLGVAALGRGDAAEAEIFLEQGLTLQLETDDRPGIAATLEQAAALHAPTDAERAACLYGAASVLREMVGTHPLQPAPHGGEETIARVAALLDQEAFTDAWSRGRAMTLEQAVDFALEKRERSEHVRHALS
jgi:predicted ATPase/DNA-binding SARP family transcriptional activator